MSTQTRQIRDSWLALRCQNGEREAFELVIKELERPLHYFVQKMVGCGDQALDVLQEVWLHFFRHVGKLEQPAHLRAWLYRIARGLAIDMIRKESALSLRIRERAAEWSPETPEPDFGNEDAEALHKALDRLDLIHKEVLVLHFLEEWTIAEVATIVGCPEGTVKSRIHQAKQNLRKILDGADMGTNPRVVRHD